MRSSLSVKGVCLNAVREVLLCRNWRGEWELPGGRPEPAENFETCLRREIAEETGLSVEVCEPIDASCGLEAIPGRWVHIVAYGCRAHEPTRLVGSAEHQAIRFFRPEELDDLRLPDAYRQAIERGRAWLEDGRAAAGAADGVLDRGLRELCLALELAGIADEFAMGRYKAAGLEVGSKSDGSPVTDADLAIEAALRTRLAQARPNHSVVGEENGSSAGAFFCWYLDPIDGTSRFAVGDPRWYTLIALAHGQSVLVAVASAPALALRWWALRGAGAFCNGRRISVSDVRTLAEATVNDDWRETLRLGIGDRPLSIIARRCRATRPHQGHSYLAVAEGHGDIAAGMGGGPWDYAPMKLIVEEAGGRFTDLDGNDSFSTGSALVSNGLLHDEAIAELARDPHSASQ
jgi:histidinol-phosphatase